MTSLKSPIFIIDDDETLAFCLEQIIGRPCRHFTNIIDAIDAIDATPPALIFLDVLLDGPNAFTLLNELASHSDLAAIPIVLMSNLRLAGPDFSSYGVVGVLDKAKMQPEEIRAYVREYCPAE